MKNPQYIFETDDVVNYLTARQLIKQYQKAKRYVMLGINTSTDFKQRQPKSENLRSFRINQKYRAFWWFNSEWNFVVTTISDHQ